MTYHLEEPSEPSDLVEHAGVKGMQWGVRKAVGKYAKSTIGYQVGRYVGRTAVNAKQLGSILKNSDEIHSLSFKKKAAIGAKFVPLVLAMNRAKWGDPSMPADMRKRAIDEQAANEAAKYNRQRAAYESYLKTSGTKQQRDAYGYDRHYPLNPSNK